MKKLFIYILILISFKSFSQKDSVEIRGQMIAIEEKLPLYNGKSKVNDTPHMALYGRFEPKGDVTAFQLVIAPSTQVSLRENLIDISQDTLIKLFYRHFLRREFKSNIKDTLSILEDNLVYIRDSSRSRIDRIFYKFRDINTFFYDLLLINKATKDTLNGLYKVRASPSNQKEYDYYIGYFNQGSPYIENAHNIFEYYKNNVLVKRRFIKKYSLIYIEDYIPLGKKRWQREIKVLGEKHISLKDTIVYKGKVKTQKKINVITHEKFTKYHKPRPYHPSTLDSIQTVENTEEFMIRSFFDDDKYPGTIAARIYNFQSAEFFRGKKRINEEEKKYRVYSSKSSYYQSILENFSRPISYYEAGFSRWIKKVKYDYRHFFADTLEYTEQKAYIEGRQAVYKIDYEQDSSYLSQVNIYKKGKKKAQMELINCKRESDDEYPYCRGVRRMSMEYPVDLYGYIFRVYNKKGLKTSEIKYYGRKDNKLKYYLKHTKVRGRRNKYYFDKNRFLDSDIDSAPYFMPRISYTYYSKEHIRKTKFDLRKVSIIDNISYKDKNDSLACQYLDKLTLKDVSWIPENLSNLENYKQGVYTIKVKNIVRYSFYKETIYNNDEGWYFTVHTSKSYDKKGKFISEKKHTFNKHYFRQ